MVLPMRMYSVIGFCFKTKYAGISVGGGGGVGRAPFIEPYATPPPPQQQQKPYEIARKPLPVYSVFCRSTDLLCSFVFVFARITVVHALLLLL